MLMSVKFTDWAHIFWYYTAMSPSSSQGISEEREDPRIIIPKIT